MHDKINRESAKTVEFEIHERFQAVNFVDGRIAMDFEGLGRALR